MRLVDSCARGVGREENEGICKEAQGSGDCGILGNVCFGISFGGMVRVVLFGYR